MDILYPIDIDVPQGSENKAPRSEVNKRLFRPRPYEDKEVYTNRLLFLAWHAHHFRWFQNWNVYHFYLKLFVHTVNEMTEYGPRTRLVICEHATNKFAETLNSTPGGTAVQIPFPNRSCLFCKKSRTYWDMYKEAKKREGIENLPLDIFKKKMDALPHIQELRQRAQEWGVKEKYYFQLFDFGAFMENQVRSDADSDPFMIQGYVGPQVLADGLISKHKAKFRFWDFLSPERNERIILYTRDNSRGARYCRYTVEIEGAAPDIPEDVRAYLAAAETMEHGRELLYDPADFIAEWSDEQKQEYIEMVDAQTDDMKTSSHIVVPHALNPEVSVTRSTSPITAPEPQPSAAPLPFPKTPSPPPFSPPPTPPSPPPPFPSPPSPKFSQEPTITAPSAPSFTLQKRSIKPPPVTETPTSASEPAETPTPEPAEAVKPTRMKVTWRK